LCINTINWKLYISNNWTSNEWFWYITLKNINATNYLYFYHLITKITMYGYFSGSCTQISVSLIFKNWSTECNFPATLTNTLRTWFHDFKIWLRTKCCYLPHVIFKFNYNLMSYKCFKKWIEKLWTKNIFSNEYYILKE